MRKPRKTAVVAVLLSAIGFLSTGAAYADGHGHKHGQGHGHKQHSKAVKGKETKTLLISQSTTCTTTEQNVDVQGQYGFQNGQGTTQSNSAGSPGSQTTRIGSTLGCNNTVVLGR
ncbi:hypothetical protein [Streptomyces sp. HD]|uniref:hypothetical protein n=1 Tax=Streptomyces sp. HD TaxID=3020892 RepID=UPI00232C0B7F|nr:hypothetical protein [Streptomyces sp. HD]MDC0772253.1 hypothetical protein [Streptomyces sp. HD]